MRKIRNVKVREVDGESRIRRKPAARLEVGLTQRLVVISGLVGSDEGLDLHHVIDLQHKGKEIISAAERCASLRVLDEPPASINPAGRQKMSQEASGEICSQ